LGTKTHRNGCAAPHHTGRTGVGLREFSERVQKSMQGVGYEFPRRRYPFSAAG
jgi:hypothetical protein